MLAEIKARIEELGISIAFDPSVAALLAKEGFDADYGARPLRRAVVRRIEDAFSTELLEGRIQVGDRVSVRAEGGQIHFEKQE